MNHRIYELMEQSYDEYTDPITDTPEYAFSREKFAKLIIMECASLTLDYKNDLHYEGWIEYRELIKEHFGIE